MRKMIRRRRNQRQWRKEVAAARSIMSAVGLNSSGMTDEEVVYHVKEKIRAMAMHSTNAGASADDAIRALARLGVAMREADKDSINKS